MRALIAIVEAACVAAVKEAESPYCDVCGEEGAALRTAVEVCRDCYDVRALAAELGGAAIERARLAVCIQAIPGHDLGALAWGDHERPWSDVAEYHERLPEWSRANSIYSQQCESGERIRVAIVKAVRESVPGGDVEPALVVDAAGAMRKALRDCAVNEGNPDTCGVCDLHFADCEQEVFARDNEPESPYLFYCAGARARLLLASAVEPVTCGGCSTTPCSCSECSCGKGSCSGDCDDDSRLP